MAVSPAKLSDDRLTMLERSPFLRLLPEEARQAVSERCVERHYHFGDVIVREGEESDAYYLLTEGRVRILKAGRNGHELPLHTLQAGESFGEIGLLNGGIRSATVRASSEVSVLRLERQVFQDILHRNPDLQRFLNLQLQHRTLFAFLKEFTSFRQAPLEALQELLESLRPVTYRAGDVIVRQDTPYGAMYVIEQGQVKVYRQRRGKQHNLAFLRAGDYFGEYSLVKQDNRHATVEAYTDCRLLALDPTPFERLLKRWPQLREIVDHRIAHYNERLEARLPLDFNKLDPDVTDHHEAPSDTPDITDQTLTAPAADYLPETSELPPAEPAAPREQRQRNRRFEFVPQIDESDCGAAALAMVCRCFGKSVSLAYIRELSDTAISGTGLKDICRAATELGLTAQAVKKAPNRVDELGLPAILHWEDNHWVVLLELRRNKARIADPAAKVSWISLDQLRDKWTGYAAVFDYTQAFDRVPERHGLWGWLVPFIKPLRPQISLAILITFAICALQLLIPKLTQITVDEVIADRDYEALNLIIMGLGGALIGTLLLMLLQRYILGLAATRLDGSIMNAIMRKLLSLPMAYFNNRRSTDIQRRLESVRAARYFLVHDSLTGLLAAVQIIAFLGLMMLFNVDMTLLFFAIMAPLYIGILYFSGKVLRPAFHNLEMSEARFQNLQTEVIKGIEIVKASGAEDRYHQRTIDNFYQLIRNQSSSKFNIFCYEGTVQAIWFMSIILFIWIGGRLVMLGELTIGTFIAFQMLLAMIYSPILTIVNLWEDLQSSSGFINTLRDIIEATSEQSHAPDTLKPVPSLAGKLAVRNLTFQYGGPESPEILRDVSFTIQPGQKVAIVGRSGSGKTTLTKCLAALMRPTRGTIYYDDVDAETVRHSDLRRHLGLVLNDNFFFSGTVTQNIAFGEAVPDPERVAWAARTTNAHDFIQQLPDGYATHIGPESGTILSNGQKQSLAIARAIYRDPAILILDEATNSLDIETERLIYDKLVELFAKRTMFIVTHRLAMITDADLILVLDKGRLIEHGRHHELLSRRGLYYHLIRRQVE